MDGSILDTLEKNVPISELVPQVTATRGNYITYVEAYGDASGRSTAAIARKRDAKASVVDSFIKLSIGANFYADGNEELLALTGLPI